jgi:hypothetical protein
MLASRGGVTHRHAALGGCWLHFGTVFAYGRHTPCSVFSYIVWSFLKGSFSTCSLWGTQLVFAAQLLLPCLPLSVCTWVRVRHSIVTHTVREGQQQGGHIGFDRLLSCQAICAWHQHVPL